jgi:hypothetical protein
MLFDAAHDCVIVGDPHFAPSALPGRSERPPGALPQAVAFRAVGAENASPVIASVCRVHSNLVSLRCNKQTIGVGRTRRYSQDKFDPNVQQS